MEQPPVLERLRPLTPNEQAQFGRLIRRLRRTDATRIVAERLLRGEVEPAVSTFLGHHVQGDFFAWRDRVISAWLLARLTPCGESRPQIVQALVAGLQRRYTTPVAWGCAGCFFGPLGLITMPAVFIISMIEDNRLHHARAAAAEALGELQAAEASGALARAIRDYSGARATSGSGVAERAAVEALPKVLSALTPEHYGRLEPTAIQDLCWVMKRGEEPLVLAILSALEKVGGGGAVAPVQSLARTSRSAAIRGKAGRILPVLQERMQKALEAQTLLRPSGAGTEGQALLRPVGGELGVGEERLLRAADPGEEGNCEAEFRV